MIGPGKYDDEASIARIATGASGVVLIILGGSKGSGFSVQASLPDMLKLPSMLEFMAQQIRADMEGGHA